MTLLPPPSDFGLPSAFPQWRRGQEAAVSHLITSTTRFDALCLPTGAGKSATLAALAGVTGLRAGFLTSTKGLADQVMRDFSTMGLQDVRGMANYRCDGMEATALALWTHQNRGRRPHPTADDGPCHDGWKCPMKYDGRCHYFTAYHKARMAHLFTTNYSYWMSINRWGEGLEAPKPRDEEVAEIMNPVELLLMDEAHQLVEELTKFLTIEVEEWEAGVARVSYLKQGASMAAWAKWGGEVYTKCQARLEDMSLGGRDKKVLRGLKKKAHALWSSTNQGGTQWVPEEATKGWKWEPVWPAPYAEEALFRGVGRVVLSSATIRPKTLQLLGVKPADSTFREYPSTFPVARRPIFHIPTVRMDKRVTPGMVELWKQRHDQVIALYPKVKGIIHTVSYARARDLYYTSRHRGRMVEPPKEGWGQGVGSNSDQTRAAIARFKTSREPLILISPSVTTGYDFPGDECRFQVISKLPFPWMKSPADLERQKQDKSYVAFLMMTELVQSVGRGVRSEDDWCATYILDDHAEWAVWANREFAPAWFMEAWQGTTTGAIPVVAF